MLSSGRVSSLLLLAFASWSSTSKVHAGDATPSLFRGSHLSAKSIPALNMKNLHSLFSSGPRSIEVSTRSKRKPANKAKRRKLPFIQNPIAGAGFYYGISKDVFDSHVKRKSKQKTLEEQLQEMKHEMEVLRRDMIALRRRLGADEVLEPHHADHHDGMMSALMARRKRQREFDRIGMEVEKWAEHLLFKEGGEEDGWKEVHCNKLVRKKLNKDKNIKCYLKWMKDPRGEHANVNDDNEYPCIKCYATVDAPMEEVCAYLAQEARVPEYNDLVVKHRDLEEITPHSKICWGHTPQILFIKPRDLVTFCHHRWLRDGTQVVVNQACEHPDAPGLQEEREGKFCRAYALRGANFISRDPDDPNKTRLALLSHANPGGGIPHWGVKTAVGVVAPIEPFKLFHRIGENVKRIGPMLERTETVSSTTGRSNQPAGLSQLGYACFWPNGGGLREGFMHPSHPDHVDPTEEHQHGDADGMKKAAHHHEDES